MKCNVKCYINGSWENDNTHFVRAKWLEYDSDFKKPNVGDEDYDLNYAYILHLKNADSNYIISEDVENIVIDYFKITTIIRPSSTIQKIPKVLFSETILIINDGKDSENTNSLNTTNNSIVIKDNDIILNNEYGEVAKFSSDSSDSDPDFDNTHTKIDSDGIVVSYKNNNIFKVTNDKISMMAGNLKKIYRYKFDILIGESVSNCAFNDHDSKIIHIYYLNNSFTISRIDNLFVCDECIHSEYININDLNYHVTVQNDTTIEKYEFGYEGGTRFGGKFKIIENKDINESCDYIIYFRVTPKFNISISGIDTYYDNNIKIYYDGIEYKNGDIIKTFDLDCHTNNYPELLNDFYNIEYKDTILTQYGLFKCEKNIVKGGSECTIDLTYYKGYYYNFEISDYLNFDNIKGIINDIVIDNNSNITISDKDINNYIFNAKVKCSDIVYPDNYLLYGEKQKTYVYLFYVNEDKEIKLKIRDYKDNEDNVINNVKTKILSSN